MTKFRKKYIQYKLKTETPFIVTCKMTTVSFSL